MKGLVRVDFCKGFKRMKVEVSVETWWRVSYIISSNKSILYASEENKQRSWLLGGTGIVNVYYIWFQLTIIALACLGESAICTLEIGISDPLITRS